jgi:hypothetical protein
MHRAPAWTDRMWEDLWERTLGQSDRHRFAMAVLRREVPRDALARRVVPELARRWRTRCNVYIAVWGLFVGFWTMVLLAEFRLLEENLAAGEADAAVSGLPPWMIASGLVVVGATVLARRWFAPVAALAQD